MQYTQTHIDHFLNVTLSDLCVIQAMSQMAAIGELGNLMRFCIYVTAK